MPETWAQIKKRHEQERTDLILQYGHLSQAQAAEALGMDQRTLSQHLSYRRIKWPRETTHRLDPDKYYERKRMADLGFPLDRIAKELGIKMESLRSWYVYNNINVKGARS